MEGSRELRTNLLRFMLISLGVMALGAFALVGMLGVGYAYWIVLGYGLLVCVALAGSARLVVQEERGTLSDTVRASSNRQLEEGWTLFVPMVPIFLGTIIRSYFPLLTGVLTLPLLVLLLGTMVWSWQRRRESRLRSRG